MKVEQAVLAAIIGSLVMITFLPFPYNFVSVGVLLFYLGIQSDE